MSNHKFEWKKKANFFFLIMLKLYTVAGIISGDLLYNKNRKSRGGKKCTRR